MRVSYLLVLALAFFVASPGARAAGPDFQHDIKPILEQKCIACHGCYDAPCQLKLESAEGLQRGASKLKVYDGTRTHAAMPTRLFFDAHSEQDWRELGFYSVIQNKAGNHSLIERMLDLGRANPPAPNARLDDNLKLGLARNATCPRTDEFNDYANKHPQGGMPLAVTGLSDGEYHTLKRWLAEGAPITPEKIEITPAYRTAIQQWENLLNYSDARHFLVARWLYEHLYLAHLYFSDLPGKPVFFQLVRSRTAPGEPIDVIATVRPNDDPGGPFWYRLRPIVGSIVHKNHITFALSDAKLARTRKQFFDPDWDVHTLPGYDYSDRANPFTTFAAIPARARYQFMLDDAGFFTRSFIRGPVCRGQIATDVIRDHFWTLFQSPDSDLFITNPRYRHQVEPLLGLPGQDDDLLSLGPQWISYRSQRNDYLDQRTRAYAEAEPKGPGFDTVWNGDGDNHNALLTIFRHHDNAAVRQGLIGGVPKTFWLFDYPLLERSYYDLVVNFDVFGNVAHQAQTRLYFDLIRNGAEMNFLRLMPADQRKQLLESWYQGMGKVKLMLSYTNLDTDQPSSVGLKTTSPIQEFAGLLLTRLQAVNAAADDPLNRCTAAPCYRKDVAPEFRQSDALLSTLSSRRAEHLPMILQLPELSLLTVTGADGQRQVYSLVRNRAHSNVAFLLGESLRYRPGQDTLTIYPGILGSYPNFGFAVSSTQMPAFVAALRNGKNQEDFEKLVRKWGVRRSNPAFWDYLSGYRQWLQQHTPIEAGILDINRYENL